MKEDKPKTKEANYWKILGIIVSIFIVSGIAFKAGTMLASADKIIESDVFEKFYSSSWSVYTTIFGLLGIILGVVFPLYQNNELKENMKKLEGDMRNLEKNKDEIIESYSIVNKISRTKRPLNSREQDDWITYLESINRIDINSNLLAYFAMIEGYNSCLLRAVSNTDTNFKVLSLIIDKIEKEFPSTLIKNRDVDKKTIVDVTVDLIILLLDKAYNDELEKILEKIEGSIKQIVQKFKKKEKELLKNILITEFTKHLKIKEEEITEIENIGFNSSDKTWTPETIFKFKDFIKRINAL